jgi:predicted transcriptional regulator
MPIVITQAHLRVYAFIKEYIGAPKSQTIADAMGAKVEDVRILLAELSMTGAIRRSRRGLYRIEKPFDTGHD